MGGFDGQEFLKIVEVYDPVKNTWEFGTELPSGRSGHASAVIYQPSCANNLIDCGFSSTGCNEKMQFTTSSC